MGVSVLLVGGLFGGCFPTGKPDANRPCFVCFFFEGLLYVHEFIVSPCGTCMPPAFKTGQAPTIRSKTASGIDFF